MHTSLKESEYQLPVIAQVVLILSEDESKNLVKDNLFADQTLLWLED